MDRSAYAERRRAESIAFRLACFAEKYAVVEQPTLMVAIMPHTIAASARGTLGFQLFC
jgi:hypothetical protein